MCNTSRKVAAVFGLLLMLAIICFTGHAQDQHTLQLENNSGYDIYEVHLSPTRSNFWGRDLLDDDVLRSGQLLNIRRVEAGDYDMKLVDEDGDECVRQISIRSDRTWNITPDRLLGCELHQLSH